MKKMEDMHGMKKDEDMHKKEMTSDKPVEKLAAVIWAAFHGAASLVQLATPRVPESYETPAATAVKYLGEDLRAVVINIVKAIEA